MATTSLIFLPKQAIRRKANKGKPSSKKKQRESLLGKCFKETFQANLLAIIKQESMAHDPETSYNKIIMTPKSGI
jgi:hypothetical protein